MNLTLATGLYQVHCVTFHGRPKVAWSHDLPGKATRTNMRATYTFMHLFENVVAVGFANTFKVWPRKCPSIELIIYHGVA
ncbi:hypothetical protein, partial [Klebsiella pneumoniae]|uniref:hypothetical protein n=1 Tax=Klebsiella pneumoniae TaxID=573 RepID=UPI0022352F27